ncbi:MAG: alpha/beta fold hydrolase [Bacteroidaceae bacterium]|nr:alpha/beta fold hydrolase [Bacteroidaceae bacterium]
MKSLLTSLAVLLMSLGMEAQPSYSVDSTVVYTSCDSIRLAATLTMPSIGESKLTNSNPKLRNLQSSIFNSQSSLPAVVLMSGTNPQDRDCTMAGHKLFLELADYLSSRGIAVLRTDDRGVGGSTGNYNAATTADFAADALAGVAYLKTVPGIDPKRIGLIGHSEGGASISIAASQSSDVAFIISLAGLMTDGLSSVIQQNKDIIAASPISDEDKARYNDINQILFQTVYDHADCDTLSQLLWHTYDQWKAVDDSLFAQRHPEETNRFRYSIYMYAQTASTPWYRFFIRYNPADYLSKVNIPVLAINGDKDIMVNCDQNLGNVRRYLQHNPDVTTHIVHGINHLLLPCERGTQDEYPTITAPTSPEVLQTVYEWIRERFLR